MNQPYPPVPTPAAQLGALSTAERAVLKAQMDRVAQDNDSKWTSEGGGDDGQTSVGELTGSFMKAALGAAVTKLGVGLLTGRQHTMGDFIWGALGAGAAGAGKHLMTGDETTVTEGSFMGMGMEVLGGHQAWSAPLVAAIAVVAVPFLGNYLSNVMGNVFGENGPGVSPASLLPDGFLTPSP